MKTIFCLLLALGLTAFGEVEREKALALMEALRTEKAPVLELKQTSFDDALGMLRKAWEKAHPGQGFPVAVVDFAQLGDGAPAGGTEKITLTLRDLTYAEAVRELANFTSRRVDEQSGFFRLVGKSWVGESFYTRPHDVPPRALAALGLRADAKGREIAMALERYDLRFKDWMGMAFRNSGRTLMVTSHAAQHEQVAGVLHLLGKGFKISK